MPADLAIIFHGSFYVCALMKSVKILFLLLLVVLFAPSGVSQTPNWCGTMPRLQQQLQNNQTLQNEFHQMLETLQSNQTAQGSRSANATYPVIYIPVVFHIIHNGDAIGTGENISEAQCISQLNAMNLHYTAQDVNLVNIPSVFAPAVANTNFQFCLAKFDPSGNPTSGITRHQFANATWDTEDDIDATLKPATIWDKNKYLNIWTVRMGGTLASNGVLAYATLPYFGAANQDGIVARYNTVGTTGSLIASHNLGKTITHEAGHWLGLLHIWGMDDGCGDAGDYVNDTPDQGDLNFGCPTFPHISCNNGPNGDMFMNYMDYTDDACSYMFTNGQSDNMHSAVNQFRSGILNASTACFYNLDAGLLNIKFPNDTICSFTFSPVVTLKNEGTTTLTSGKFYFQIDGDAVQIFNWSGSLPSQSTTEVTLPEQQVFLEDIHTLDVTFGNANGQAQDNFSGNDSKSLTFFALHGSAGSTLPFTETFENNFPPANWSVYNPNNDVITWEQNPSYGSYGNSSRSVWLNNTAYGINPNKKKDAFITDSYDFTNITFPELKFDVAYARYNASRSDSLNLYYSLDCGSNWQKVWSQNGADLATAPDQTTLFTPNHSQWKTVAVPLLSLIGQHKVSFKFENVSGWGNALYIDNINLQSNPSLSVQPSAKTKLQIFPNPASTLAGVRLPDNHPFKNLQLINALGQLIYETPINDNAIIFPVSACPDGIYLLHFTGDKTSQTEKLLIAR